MLSVMSVRLSVILSTRGPMWPLRIILMHWISLFRPPNPRHPALAHTSGHYTLLYKGSWAPVPVPVLVPVPVPDVTSRYSAQHIPIMEPHFTGKPLRASDIWWASLETCSSLFKPSTDIWWLLRHVRLVQVRFTHHTGMLSCFNLYPFSNYEHKYFSFSTQIILLWVTKNIQAARHTNTYCRINEKVKVKYIQHLLQH